MPLHPIFATAFQAASQAGRPALSAGSPADARTLIDAGAGPLGAGPAIETVSNLDIPTRDGSVKARLFRSSAQTPGLVVYFHGGGWVAGSVEGFDALGRELAAKSGCAVLSVEYRLAPEHPYPSGLHDAIDAVRWAYRERQQLTGCEAPLVLAGDSAGGNLAAVTALELRNQIPVALQVLFYPVTDANFETASYTEFGAGPGLSLADMKWFFDHYAPPDQRNDPRISPLQANVAGVAPAWIALAEYDVLRSEGEAYAKHLENAGVRVQLKTYEGLPHGFARWYNLVSEVALAIDDASAAINAAVTY
ncbi:MAG: alpha/beta hydrolase [Janthinobacterium lividum]